MGLANRPPRTRKAKRMTLEDAIRKGLDDSMGYLPDYDIGFIAEAVREWLDDNAVGPREMTYWPPPFEKEIHHYGFFIPTEALGLVEDPWQPVRAIANERGDE